MIEVYVRLDIDDSGKLLGNFSIEDVDFLPNTFKTFSTYYVTEEEEFKCKFLNAIFVMEKDKTFFEIIVTIDE